MKNKIWLTQIPVALLFTFLFWVDEQAIQGKLHNAFLREKVRPALSRVSTLVTDIKFRTRGPQPPKNKVVVVEIDSPSIERLGRWPWHRDVTAFLIDKVFSYGAKVVGLDIMFSEPDVRVPPELAEVLKKNKLGELVDQFETDAQLEKVIAVHRDNVVLGWMTETPCQPGYAKTADECPVTHPDAIASHPQGYDKFAYTHFKTETPFDPAKTSLVSVPTFLSNIQRFNDSGAHAGYLNVFIDDDSVIRRTNLLMFADGKPYPSIAVEMARVGLGEDLQVSLDKDSHVSSIGFAKSGRQIPVTPLGVMQVNFRGPQRTFQYVSALDVMGDETTINVEQNRKPAAVTKTDLFKDAYVLVGVSAIGVFDMRSFPFDPYTPGVEGHANILDNILSGDPIVRGSGKASSVWIFLLMVVGALAFAFVAERFEAIPALILFVVAFFGFGAFDQKVLFENNINWNTAFFYFELAAIFMITLAVKYVMEERNKKFIRGAFAKYLSPHLVDEIIKDPSKMTLGGQKKDLTIMFSDIRSFTTFSEKMDAKQLAGFLNEYLGKMTDVVFEHEGTLDKYIGDAVMAFWGAPLDQPKHAANACRAAKKMMQLLAVEQPKFKEKYGIDVDIGIGINSGPVNVGNMGSDRVFEYTVIGDHVNLASRMEGLTKPYGCSIVASRFTFDLIAQSGEPLPEHRVLDFVKVKGKKKAVELLQVLDKEYNKEGLELFEKARVLYTQQKWDEAISMFNKANDVLAPKPDAKGHRDGPTEMYLERCEEFKKNPPAADWDGSWEMHSK